MHHQDMGPFRMREGTRGRARSCQVRKSETILIRTLPRPLTISASGVGQWCPWPGERERRPLLQEFSGYCVRGRSAAGSEPISARLPSHTLSS